VSRQRRHVAHDLGSILVALVLLAMAVASLVTGMAYHDPFYLEVGAVSALSSVATSLLARLP
jgi:hypothetical protein